MNKLLQIHILDEKLGPKIATLLEEQSLQCKITCWTDVMFGIFWDEKIVTEVKSVVSKQNLYASPIHTLLYVLWYYGGLVVLSLPQNVEPFQERVRRLVLDIRLGKQSFGFNQTIIWSIQRESWNPILTIFLKNIYLNIPTPTMCFELLYKIYKLDQQTIDLGMFAPDQVWVKPVKNGKSLLVAILVRNKVFYTQPNIVLGPYTSSIPRLT